MCYYYSHIMRQVKSTTSTHGVYYECKVNWFCTCTQESDRQRINKTQKHKEEAAATGINIARIR